MQGEFRRRDSRAKRQCCVCMVNSVHCCPVIPFTSVASFLKITVCAIEARPYCLRSMDYLNGPLCDTISNTTIDAPSAPRPWRAPAPVIAEDHSPSADSETRSPLFPKSLYFIWILSASLPRQPFGSEWRVFGRLASQTLFGESPFGFSSAYTGNSENYDWNGQPTGIRREQAKDSRAPVGLLQGYLKMEPMAGIEPRQRY